MKRLIDITNNPNGLDFKEESQQLKERIKKLWRQEEIY